MKTHKEKITAEIFAEIATVRFLTPAVREAVDAQKALSEIESIAYSNKISILIIDFSKLVQLTSVFLGRLIQLQKSLKELGIKLRAFGLREDVERAFKICKLHKIIPTYATEEEAING
jgi:anti-anti-sigma factor